jgi:hypothetical protein
MGRRVEHRRDRAEPDRQRVMTQFVRGASNAAILRDTRLAPQAVPNVSGDAFIGDGMGFGEPR